MAAAHQTIQVNSVHHNFYFISQKKKKKSFQSTSTASIDWSLEVWVFLRSLPGSSTTNEKKKLDFFLQKCTEISFESRWGNIINRSDEIKLNCPWLLRSDGHKTSQHWSEENSTLNLQKRNQNYISDIWCTKNTWIIFSDMPTSPNNGMRRYHFTIIVNK